MFQFIETHNGLELLMKLLETDISLDFTVRSVSAVSWVIRFSPHTLNKFFDFNGVDILKKLLLRNKENLSLRIVFTFVNLLISDFPEVRAVVADFILKQDLDTLVMNCFTEEQTELREKCAEFIKKFSSVLHELKRNDIPLDILTSKHNAFLEANPIVDVDADLVDAE